MIESAVVAPGDGVVLVAIRDLTTNASFREGGVNHEHVQQLVTVAGHWPPILVTRTDGVVIDGVHRVTAAKLLGMDHVYASFFDGGADEALIEFVRRNVHHGLPLTLRERKRAAETVLRAHPQWSDRRIAELCALSPKTVGRLRVSRGACLTEEVPHLDTGYRIGRDNKSRPVNSAWARARVVETTKDQPEASLRAVAASVGVSPETVRRIRMRISDEENAPSARGTRPPKDTSWEQDPALTSGDDGHFGAWFERTCISDEDCWGQLETVPRSRIYEVADEARRRSELWMQFARSLEARSKKRK
jgi:ParB-like chromosome segregation protein Spo0J